VICDLNSKTRDTKRAGGAQPPALAAFGISELQTSPILEDGRSRFLIVTG
jgi:hypothetical protein